MKTPVAVSMLIFGALLIVAPFAFDALHEHEMARMFIARKDLNNLSFGDGMASSPLGRFGCWLTGTSLCLIATFGAAREARRPAAVPAGLAQVAGS